MVVCRVLASRKHLKVARIVVSTVLVTMVDNLSGEERASQHSRHDNPMLQIVLLSHTNHDVSVASDEPSPSPVRITITGTPSGWITARARAIGSVPSLEGRRVGEELGTTCGTDAEDRHRPQDSPMVYGTSRFFGNPLP
jgi:hypothetical protein